MGQAPQESVDIGAPIVPSTRDRDLDRTRKLLALVLLAILGFEIVAALLSVIFASGTKDAVKEMLGLLFTPTVALVGAATGFYFGQRSTTGQ